VTAQVLKRGCGVFVASLVLSSAGACGFSTATPPATGGSGGAGPSAGSGGNGTNEGSGGAAGPGSGGASGSVGTDGSAPTGSGGTAPGPGTGGAGPGPGTGGSGPLPGMTFANYELTGTMPGLKSVIATKPGGKLTYQKIVVHDQFLAESCSIADYNHDNIPDLSAGRRWYEGPSFTKVHIFRGGHDALPRAGASAELVDGVSDDWADYPWDMDGDGWADIINIASSDADERVSMTPRPQAHATGYWYKNPGAGLAGDPMWTGYLMHSGFRQEQHGLVDVDGDGKPEIYGACRDCVPTQTKGYFQADWTKPTAQWTYHAVTPKDMYPFPFGGTGWLHGIGFGDVNKDGKPDLLERGGVWLQGPNGTFAGGSMSITACTSTPGNCGWFNTPLWNGDNAGNQGGAHMYAYDIDGDGDIDIFSADWAHGEGLAWYEQQPGMGGGAPRFVKHYFMRGNGDKGQYGGIYFSEPHAAQAVDMDGDGVPDVITGKMRFAHPLDQNDPDPHGVPYLYVFKTVRDANPGVSGMAHFEAKLVDGGMPGAAEGATGMAGAVGVGRQLSVGHINTDGIPDICVATKLGLYVFYGQ
jgi:hypothetical protein